MLPFEVKPAFVDQRGLHTCNDLRKICQKIKKGWRLSIYVLETLCEKFKSSQ